MKVLITGPESSGKSYLARALAWCLDGIFVAEQARYYLTALERPYGQSDLETIWQLQRQAENAAISTGNACIICDTGPEVMQIWSEVKYGSCSSDIKAAVTSRPYDIVFLCYPDIPWTYDPLRETPDPMARKDIFDRYAELLPDAFIIRGSSRIGSALAHLECRTKYPKKGMQKRK